MFYRGVEMHSHQIVADKIPLPPVTMLLFANNSIFGDSIVRGGREGGGHFC